MTCYVCATDAMLFYIEVAWINSIEPKDSEVMRVCSTRCLREMIN